jgi:hypothetical protein
LEGNSFMVVDAGGGTIDISVHHKTSDSHLVECVTPSEGDWGSTYINKQFEELLEELVGKEQLNAKKDTAAWYEIIDYFEVCRQL